MDELRLQIEKIFKNEDFEKLFKSVIINIPNQSNKITVICKLDDYIFMMKIYSADPVVCNNDHKNGKDSPYVESSILKVLNDEFFDMTPCIPALLYVNKMTESSVKKHKLTIQKCLDSGDNLCVVWNALNAGITIGPPTFILMEAGDFNLGAYCRFAQSFNDVWIIKSLIWMILYTINLIRKKYPKFKHGDLYTRNIILYLDSEYGKEDRLGQKHYLQIGEYYIPYVGIIPKIIDYELSVLDDNIRARYNSLVETDDILQLLFDVSSFWQSDNKVTELVDDILGVKLKRNISYIQASDIVNRNGGLQKLEKMLDSAVFGYQKGGVVDEDSIWGSW